MTQDEIIEMARQAGIPSKNIPSLAFGRVETGLELLEAFAKLVAAKSTDEANARANASWTLMCKKMVEAEREACAKEAETTFYSVQAAENIRARGEA
jgi:cellobiose-specific phosphotransferase system component IIB